MKGKIIYIWMITCSLLICSCENWFDVQPKTQIKGDDLFSTESGFGTALYGAYTSMSSNMLYGGELTMGFMDVLAQYYLIRSNTHSYYQAMNFNYDDDMVEATTDAFWSNMYKTITNINNLLENLEARREILSDVSYNIIKGEALGLRAYLHFDILRMYAPSAAVDINHLAIPYVDRVSTVPFPQLTTQQALLRVLEDIDNAIECLRTVDTWSPENTISQYTENEQELLQFRSNHLNYLALGALKARVLLWKGDTNEAYNVAENIVNQDSISSIGSPLFSIYTDKLTDYADDYYSPDAYSRLIVGKDAQADIYELTDIEIQQEKYKDSRAANFVGYYTGSSEVTVTKYKSNGLWMNQVPLIRVCELYYILAECAPSETLAIDYINKVRDTYGLTEDYYLRPGLCVVEDEIYKEYRKSFVGEGQLFYYMKRKDFKKLPSNVEVADIRSIWCFDFPNDEIEFGNIK